MGFADLLTDAGLTSKLHLFNHVPHTAAELENLILTVFSAQ
jgi:hypothetical protein